MRRETKYLSCSADVWVFPLWRYQPDRHGPDRPVNGNNVVVSNRAGGRWRADGQSSAQRAADNSERDNWITADGPRWAARNETDSAALREEALKGVFLLESKKHKGKKKEQNTQMRQSVSKKHFTERDRDAEQEVPERCEHQGTLSKDETEWTHQRHTLSGKGEEPRLCESISTVCLFSTTQIRLQILTGGIGEHEFDRLVFDVAHVSDRHLAGVVSKVLGSQVF